jgi:tetratricopeptide (TPR) repeat protein
MVYRKFIKGQEILRKGNIKQGFRSAKAATKAGRNFAQRGQLQKALFAFTTAVVMDCYQWDAYRLRGIAYAKMGRYRLAMKNLDMAIQHIPLCAGCFFERGTVKMLSGKLESALEDLSQCVKLEPEYAPAYSSRAAIFTRKGFYQRALKDIKTALSLHPQNINYRHNRAVIFTALGRYREAIEDYEHVIKLNPKSGGSYNNLAWLLSTVKDPAYRDCRKAIFYARKALRIDKNESWMDTLAAAYAECGNFEKAVSIEEEAYKKSKPPNENFHQRIEIYKMGKTYVEWRAERNLSLQ